jgi:hypothetical protein
VIGVLGESWSNPLVGYGWLWQAMIGSDRVLWLVIVGYGWSWLAMVWFVMVSYGLESLGELIERGSAMRKAGRGPDIVGYGWLWLVYGMVC